MKGGPYFAKMALLMAIKGVYQANLVLGSIIDEIKKHDPEDRDYWETKQEAHRAIEFYSYVNKHTQEMERDLHYRVTLPSKLAAKPRGEKDAKLRGS